MEDALWKLFGFILAVVLVIVVPMMSLLERQDDMTLAIAQAEATRFADTARDMGTVTPAMYERFVNRLHATGLRYDIRLRHQRHQWQPVYETTPTGLLFTGEYTRSVMTEGEQVILAALYPPAASQGASQEASGSYRMHVGDQFHVEITSTGESAAAAWRRMFLSAGTAEAGILARAGGMVRNEAP
jgi:hypothetical protein